MIKLNHLSKIPLRRVSKIVNKSYTRFFSEVDHHDSPVTTKVSDASTGYRVPNPPSGLPISKILRRGVVFPLSVKDSIRHYGRRNNLDEIQSDLLSILPFYPHPSETHSSRVIHTIVNDSTGEYINEFYITPRDPKYCGKEAKHVIFIHGYGAGLGFFVKNLEEIAKKKPHWHIHAIDLPGYGCSSRPDFPYNIRYSEYEKIEQWFIDRMASWFDQRGLNRHNTIVVAHSMGAYLSCILNFQRPDLFSKMLLVSPAGIYHSNADEVIHTAPSWFRKLWARNISPFSLVRNAGPLGSMLVSGWTSRRFSKNDGILKPLEQKLMHMYSYAIFNAKGSGEYMLNYFLAPGGVPRHPLLNRIQNLNCDTIWLYGSHDWMDKSGGVKACNILRGLKNENGQDRKAIYHVVGNSGHHIYLDNFNEFNRLMITELNKFETL